MSVWTLGRPYRMTSNPSGRTPASLRTTTSGWILPPSATGTVVPLPLDECKLRALPGSPLRFDLDTGVLVGASMGYALNSLRIEAEYVYRQHKGELLPLIVPGDEKQ